MTIEKWESLESSIRDDLVAWFNITEPDDGDLDRLAKLFEEGGFESWDCPMCGDRCYNGDVEQVFGEEGWNHFQGVCNPDGSYYGDLDIFTEDFTRRCCDTCRCHPTQFFPSRSSGAVNWKDE